MMSTHPKQYSAAFKTRLVRELLREEKTISQLAAEHGIHTNQLTRWRAIALEGMPSLFERRDHTEALTATYTREREELYAQIGRLSTQLAWLKRKTGIELPAG